MSAGAESSRRPDKASAHRAVWQRANVFKAKRGKHKGLASPLGGSTGPARSRRAGQALEPGLVHGLPQGGDPPEHVSSERTVSSAPKATV